MKFERYNNIYGKGLMWSLATKTYGHFHDTGFWFKIFGYGIGVLNRDKQKPLFSVRYGYTKEYRIGKWGIQFNQHK